VDDHWPILKARRTAELGGRLTYIRALTLPFAGLGLLAIAKVSGESVRNPARDVAMVGLLALFNITGWNGLVLFACARWGRAQRDHRLHDAVWATLVSLAVLHEPLGRRKVVGLALGMAGCSCSLGDDFRAIERRPFGRADDPRCRGGLGVRHGAAAASSSRSSRRTPDRLEDDRGWWPIASRAALRSDLALHALDGLSPTAWFAIAYNIAMAGTLAPWRGSRSRAHCPSGVVDGVAAVPVVGVLPACSCSANRPGAPEWMRSAAGERRAALGCLAGEAHGAAPRTGTRRGLTGAHA